MVSEYMNIEDVVAILQMRGASKPLVT